MFNQNSTITKYKVVPDRKQFSIAGGKYIWESHAAYYDHKEKIFTAVYYEGTPMPVLLYGNGRELKFNTIDSDTYTQVQKMEYIKTLAATGQISKILKQNFLVSVLNMFGTIAIIIMCASMVMGG